MLSLNDIINVVFRKSGFSGYRTDDVDAFVDRVRESFDELLKKGVSQEEQIEKLKAENQQAAEKLKVLADKIEEYRAQEDEIKNALISAQKLGDASVREARHRAEIILKDAGQKAERIVAGADEKVDEQKQELERLQQAVSDFRSKLLSAYKEHLTLIDALPAHKPEPERAAEPKHAPQPEQARQQEQALRRETEPEPAGFAPEESAEPEAAFQAEISNFEDEPEK
jgi:cell division initiation protein